MWRSGDSVCFVSPHLVSSPLVPKTEQTSTCLAVTWLLVVFSPLIFMPFLTSLSWVIQHLSLSGGDWDSHGESLQKTNADLLHD